MARFRNFWFHYVDCVSNWYDAVSSTCPGRRWPSNVDQRIKKSFWRRSFRFWRYSSVTEAVPFLVARTVFVLNNSIVKTPCLFRQPNGRSTFLLRINDHCISLRRNESECRPLMSQHSPGSRLRRNRCGIRLRITHRFQFWGSHSTGSRYKRILIYTVTGSWNRTKRRRIKCHCLNWKNRSVKHNAVSIE